MSTDKPGWKGFLELCLSTKDTKTLATLFDFYLTAEEQDNLAMRYSLVKELLKQEKTQRQIAKDLQVSIAKITRGSNELKRLSPKLLDYLKEHILVAHKNKE